MPKQFIYKTFLEITFILLGAMSVFFMVCGIAFAAPNVDITYKAPDSAATGNTVSVTIDVSGDTSLTTLGLRLHYDKEKVQYENGQWATGLKDSNSSMTLISDVEYNGGQVLNISMISEAGYQDKGTMVTLTFLVKESYTENPFRLELREATDSGTQSVAGSTKITFQGIGTSGGSSGGSSSGGGNESLGGGSGTSGEETESSGGGNGTSGEETESLGGGNGSSGSGNEAAGDGADLHGSGIPAGGADANKNVADSGSSRAGGAGSESSIAKSGKALTENVTVPSGTSTGNDGNRSVSTTSSQTFQTGIDVYGAKIFLFGGAFGLIGMICVVIRRKLSE